MLAITAIAAIAGDAAIAGGDGDDGDGNGRDNIVAKVLVVPMVALAATNGDGSLRRR